MQTANINDAQRGNSLRKNKSKSFEIQPMSGQIEKVFCFTEPYRQHQSVNIAKKIKIAQYGR